MEQNQISLKDIYEKLLKIETSLKELKKIEKLIEKYAALQNRQFQ